MFGGFGISSFMRAKRLSRRKVGCRDCIDLSRSFPGYTQRIGSPPQKKATRKSRHSRDRYATSCLSNRKNRSNTRPGNWPSQGTFPYTRGLHPGMYRDRLWTMRQYAGFGDAVQSNQRYRYLISQGTSGLSVAFDLPTQMGYDSDHPLSLGEVGKAGVAICSLADMEQLFDGIPLQGCFHVHDDQFDRHDASGTLRRLSRESKGTGHRRTFMALSRTTFSRSTSLAAPTSIRRRLPCGSLRTCLPGPAVKPRIGT